MVFLTREVRRLVSFVAVSLVCGSHALVAQPTLEDDVKAAFLYNFTKFIEWPMPQQADEPFRLCAIADAPIIAALDRTIADESVGGRRLVRVEPQSLDEARGCAILYVGKSSGERGARLVAGVRDLPVLTVGEGAQFVKQGGAIGFLLENNRVRFDISARSLQRSGLRASSKLLRVARAVEGGVS
jgi:YfiR/HmsC-like